MLLLAGIIVVAAVARFRGLGAESIWFDEWSTLQAVGRKLPDTLTYVAEREGSPPGYFLVAWLWSRVVGNGDGAMRALSAIAGTLVVPVAYATAWELIRSRMAARVVAVLVAVHPLLVWYSQEARPYSLLTLAGALSLLFFARSWARGSRTDLWIWGACAAAAVSVHYFAVFLVISEAAALVLRHRKQWRRIALALLPTLAVGLALVPVVLEQRRHAENQSWITGFALADRLEDAGRTVLVGPNPWSDRLWLLVAVVALVALLAGVWSRTTGRGETVLAVGLGAGAALLPLVALVVGVDMFLGRYVIAAVIPLLIAVGIAVASFPRRWLGVGVAAVLCVTFVSTLVATDREPAQQRPAWGEVARVFKSGDVDQNGGRLLVLNAHGGLAAPLEHYLGRGARRLEPGDETLVSGIDIVVTKGTTAPCSMLIGSACAFVFLGAPLPPPLDSQFTLEQSIELDQFTINRYRADQPIPVTKEDVVRSGEVPDSLVLLRT